MSVTTPYADLGPTDRSDLNLPPGRRIRLGRRGTSFYREVPGPPGAPTLLLLHGWVASGGLNWFASFETLSRRFRVIAPDLRGHGRGIRSWQRFSLDDCADDVAALLGRVSSGPVIAVGYSMGGAVAQLLWRRHRDRVAGLVLCATGGTLVPKRRDRMVFTTAMTAVVETMRVGQLSAVVPRALVNTVVQRARPARPRSLPSWAALEMARHDWRMLMEAGLQLGRFDASSWLPEIDVPTAVVVTTQDRALGPMPQLQLARSIRGATIHAVDDGHVACARESFAAPLLAACDDVAQRAALRRLARAS